MSLDYSFVADPEHGFLLLRHTKEKNVFVRVSNNQTLTLSASTPRFPASEQSLSSIDDMADLQELSEAAILHNIRMRFDEKKIFTAVGPVLISTNPFQTVNLFTPDTLEAYVTPNKLLPPHIFGMARNIYESLALHRKDQALLISGESGAGKTELTKLFLQFVTEVSTRRSSQELSGESSKLHSRILTLNPILEAFGNAKTCRNDNSSRFGKWTSVKFDSMHGCILGARVLVYLLEKSRLCMHAPGERSFHIFYMLLAGADPVLKEKLHLHQADKYKYLYNDGDSPIAPPVAEDVQAFNDLLRALRSVGIGPAQEAELVQVLAGLLHLGNVEFQAVLPTSDACTVANRAVMTVAADLLGIPAAALDNALRSKDVSNSKEVLRQNRSVAQARDTRDALAKSLYGKLFDWIVTSINSSLVASDARTPAPVKNKEATLLGVFDIFGFEIFQENSFEQLCINYANEKLQDLFTQVLVTAERQELLEQGLAANLVEGLFATDSVRAAVLPAFEDKKTGLFSLIEDEATMPRGSDESLVSKIKNIGGGVILRTSTQSPTFTVRHFAGAVEYNPAGFLDKARDRLEPALEQLVLASQMGLVSNLASVSSPATEHLTQKLTETASKRFSLTGEALPTRRTSVGVSKSSRTVASKFQQQLGDLVDSLSDTQIWFARCIKPNGQHSPSRFDAPDVLAQLSNSGILQVCRLRQSGFPIHLSKQEFAWRYSLLGGNKCLAAFPGMFHEGPAKILLQSKVYEALETQRSALLLAHARTIQRIYRGHAARLTLSGVKQNLAALTLAITRNDAEAIRLSMRLLLNGHVPDTHPALLKARTVLQVHDEQAMARTRCQTASTLDDALVALRFAEAAQLDKTDSAYLRCKQMIAAGESARKLRGKIIGHISARLLSPLAESIGEARTMIASQPALESVLMEAIAEGESLVKRLKAEREGLERASQAGQSNDAKVIEAALANLYGLGLGLHASAQSLQRTLKILREPERAAPSTARNGAAAVGGPTTTSTKTPAAAPEPTPAVVDIPVAAAPLAEERQTQVEKTLVRLKTAEKMQSLRELEEARREALRLGLDQDADVQRAAQLQASLSEKKDVGSELEAACTALRLKAESSKLASSLRVADVESLAEAVALAKQKGLSPDAKQVLAAKELEAKVRSQIMLHSKLEVAMRSRDPNALKTALEEAERAQLDNDLVRRVRALVKRRKQGRTTTPHDRMWETQKLSERDVMAARSKRIALVAASPAFDFIEYPGLRSDLEWPTPKDALYKCSWTGQPITSSLTRAAGVDSQANKRAVLMNKAVLGFCGDLVMNYSNMLALQILETALIDPVMADEMYCQLLKQLSNNRERESERRAWRLAAIVSSCLGPSDETLENVVLRFFIQKVEAADLLVEREVARYTLRKFERQLALGASGVIPTADEVQAFLTRPPVLATITFPDGADLVKDFPVGPDVDVGELVDACISLTGLSPKVHQLFGIFIDANKKEAQDRRLRYMKRYRIADVEMTPKVIGRDPSERMPHQMDSLASFATASSSSSSQVSGSPPRPSSLTASTSSPGSRRSLNLFRRFSRRPVGAAPSPGGLPSSPSSPSSPSDLDLASLVASTFRLPTEDLDMPLSLEPVSKNEYLGDFLVTRASLGSLSLVMKRRRILAPEEDDVLLKEDSTYALFVFREVAWEILAGHWGLPSKEVVAQFAALFLNEAHGKPPAGLISPSILEDFIPPTWREVVTEEDWLVLVSDAVKNLPRFVDVVALRLNVIAKAQKLHCYGLSTFYVKLNGAQAVLGVNGVGLHFLASDPMRTSTKLVTHKRVTKIVANSETLEVHAWRDKDDEAMDRIERLVMGTVEATRIGDLLSQYGDINVTKT